MAGCRSLSDEVDERCGDHRGEAEGAASGATRAPEPPRGSSGRAAAASGSPTTSASVSVNRISVESSSWPARTAADPEREPRSAQVALDEADDEVGGDRQQEDGGGVDVRQLGGQHVPEKPKTYPPASEGQIAPFVSRRQSRNAVHAASAGIRTTRRRCRRGAGRRGA